MTSNADTSLQGFILRLATTTVAVVVSVGVLDYLGWSKAKPMVAPPPSVSAPASPAVAEDPLFGASHYALSEAMPRPDATLISYGKRLVDETNLLLGPTAQDESMRYTGNGLACKNCHLDSGIKPFAAPYVGTTRRFPSFGGRENRIGTLEARINGCMERSMNGRALPEDGAEMRAIVAYMGWLSHRAPESGQVKGQGFIAARYPERAVDLAKGREVFTKSCALCHGSDGLGKPAALGPGYQFPPLAGPDSYNTGAGMHRVLTAMAFIKSNMPLGATADTPLLSDEEAYDVAGYINSLPRPIKPNTELDYPDRTLKPMSSAYGPYADDFPPEQHKFGPFAPIYSYYKNKYNLKKDK